MKSKSPEFYEARARIAKALAHPSRLLILDALHRKELCVADLTTLVGSDQSTVSKHLSVLKQAGLVLDRKNGVQVFYRPCCPCIDKFWECIEAVLQQNLRRQAACCT